MHISLSFVFSIFILLHLGVILFKFNLLGLGSISQLCVYLFHQF